MIWFDICVHDLKIKPIKHQSANSDYQPGPSLFFNKTLSGFREKSPVCLLQQAPEPQAVFTADNIYIAE